MSDKVSVYDVISETITKRLEAGVAPWRMPWSKIAGTAPKNIKGNAYRGCNFFLLSMLGYGDPTFLTFKQAKALGGNVRKGEKGYPVIFWTLLKKENEKTGKEESIPCLRYYTVFNVSQVDDLKYEAPAAPENTFSGIEAAEKIVAGYKDSPQIQEGGNRACYNRLTDIVTTPHKGQFKSEEDFYSTLFHELGHSTGHSKRLNRKELVENDGFGGQNYSNEELVAELTAAFLCAHAQIDNETLEDSASYIQGWLSKLKKDPKAFVTAAGKAQKAADHILGVEWKKESNED